MGTQEWGVRRDTFHTPTVHGTFVVIRSSPCHFQYTVSTIELLKPVIHSPSLVHPGFLALRINCISQIRHSRQNHPLLFGRGSSFSLVCVCLSCHAVEGTSISNGFGSADREFEEDNICRSTLSLLSSLPSANLFFRTRLVSTVPSGRVRRSVVVIVETIES